MNKKLLSLLVLPALWCNHSTAAATGTVYRMVCYTGSAPVCQVSLNLPVSGVNVCATSGWHYTFDPSTEGGKAVMSMVLAAQLSKQTITFAGTGLCTNASENLSYAYITTAP